MTSKVAVAVFLSVVLAGCSAGPVPEAPSSTDGDPPATSSKGDDSLAVHPNATVEPEPGREGGTRESLPPGGPREDEVWKEDYDCMEPLPGIVDDCRREYEFRVEALYEAVTATVTMTSPGIVFSNGLLVRLEAPDDSQTYDHFNNGPYAGREEIIIRVEDPLVLAQLGMWTLTLGTGEVAATKITYEARVSFTPHPDFSTPACNRAAVTPPHCPVEPPESIALNTTWYMGGGIPIEWDRVATILPEGFEPVGYPGDPILNEPRGLPEGTYSNLGGILLEYEEAWVDDVRLPEGRLALALTIVNPSADHDVGKLRNWMILAAAASDPRLGQALSSWGIDAIAGEIDMALEAAGPDTLVARARGNVQSDLLAFTVDVSGQGASGGRFGDGEPPQKIGNWGARNGEAGPPLIYTLPAHNQRPGPVTLGGRFGALGEVEPTTGTGTAATWFGAVGGAPGENAPGELRFDRIDALEPDPAPT